MTDDKRAESDADILAQAIIYMRADRYVWRSTKPPPKTQDLMAWLDAALRFIDDSNATIAVQAGEIERLTAHNAKLSESWSRMERKYHAGYQTGYADGLRAPSAPANVGGQPEADVRGKLNAAQLGVQGEPSDEALLLAHDVVRPEDGGDHLPVKLASARSSADTVKLAKRIEEFAAARAAPPPPTEDAGAGEQPINPQNVGATTAALAPTKESSAATTAGSSCSISSTPSADADALERAREVLHSLGCYRRWIENAYAKPKDDSDVAAVAAALTAAEARAYERAVRTLTEWLPALTAVGQGHTGAAIIDELRALATTSGETK